MSKADIIRENEQLRAQIAALQKGGSAAGTIFTVIFMLVIMAAFGLLLADRLGVNVPGVPPAQVVFSTPRVPSPLPSAAIIPGAARIVEATFPPPAPVVVPTDTPAPPPTPWPVDSAATSQAATDAAGVMTATAEGQSAIDRWLHGPPSTPTPTAWADFVQSFATPEPCSPFVGYVSGPCAAPKE